MPSTRDIRRRIKSVKNTRQITRAMELVAASKMGKAQQAALSGRPFTALLAQILDSVAHQLGEELTHPLLDRRPVRHRGVLLISTARGLCGALNSNLFRVVTEIGRNARFVSMGRKGTQFLARTGREIMAEFPLSDHVPIAEIRPAADLLTKAFLDGEVDTLEVVYSQFVNTLVQKPVRVSLLPLDNISEILETLWGGAGAEPLRAPRRDLREMAFEPGPEQLLNLILPMFIRLQIFQFARSAKASEHSARMVAMKTAKDNASNLLDELTLEYNKARQAAITAEILEIAAATGSDTY